ncbi:hypothetical protein ACELLULO517_15900 [Acidisoma cellulosilytica]|uniref:Uncharacterized protein n=1 Tax=Acidisoma cellulosilyticum TaxID=2802395 RepID=A0A964E4U1_9PROT|nr:hypothetical protein [Acidisoma cellulosilyticum]MCB8881732.1 hypothetical protein [Acidisoma cellulosilyticum]
MSNSVYIDLPGDTYRHRDTIKFSGGKFDSTYKIWRVPAAEFDRLNALVNPIKIEPAKPAQIPNGWFVGPEDSEIEIDGEPEGWSEIQACHVNTFCWRWGEFVNGTPIDVRQIARRVQSGVIIAFKTFQIPGYSMSPKIGKFDADGKLESFGLLSGVEARVTMHGDLGPSAPDLRPAVVALTDRYERERASKLGQTSLRLNLFGR